MNITIPDIVLEESNLTPAELLLEIAIYFYSKKLLTIGQARKIANMDLISFQKQLASRQISIHYTTEDLEKDLKNLGLLQ